MAEQNLHLNSDPMSIQASSGGRRAKPKFEAKRRRSFIRGGRRKEVSLSSDKPHRIAKGTFQGVKCTWPIVVQMSHTRERVSQLQGMFQKDIPASFNQTSKGHVHRAATTLLTGAAKKRKKPVTKR